MAGEQHDGTNATVEGEWFIELGKGWSPWIVEGLPFQGNSVASFRYRYGKTDFEAHFQSETEGIQKNITTGKTRLLRKQARHLSSFSEGSDSRKMQQQSPVEKRPAAISSQRPSLAAKPLTTKAENLPTCYFLASSGQSYDGDFEWLIELEKGWTPWMPENEPFEGPTDQPLRYTLGRYEFEVNFTNDSHGTQTNLLTGKVRRIQRRHKAEPMPAWEGTGVRRRPASGGAAELPAAPPSSEASVAQARRAERRASGGYGGALSSPSPAQRKSPAPEMRLSETQRPRVSQSAIPSTVPRYMRGLKSKMQA